MTMTVLQSRGEPVPPAHPRSRSARWRGSLAFEWTKLASIRSTWFSLVIALLVTLGVGVLLGVSARASAENGFDSAAPSPYLAFQAILVAQFPIVVVAALFITAEYSSGSIRTTLQSVPVRGRMLASKLIILAGGGLVTGVLLSVLGTLVTAPAAGQYGAFTAGEFVGTVLAAGGYLAMLSIMVLGLGAALRSAAGTITTILVLLFALPQLLPVFGVDWLTDLVKYLPTNAATVLGLQVAQPYGWAVALLVLGGWGLAAVVAGYTVLRARDA
jgi:ABC-2 type transport system permease protein